MLKQQRRPSSRQARSNGPAPSAPSSRSGGANDRSEPQSPQRLAPTPVPGGPTRRSTYFEAVALYERGMEALQRHEYRAATELLASVLPQDPQEKEVHQRGPTHPHNRS